MLIPVKFLIIGLVTVIAAQDTNTPTDEWVSEVLLHVDVGFAVLSVLAVLGFILLATVRYRARRTVQTSVSTETEGLIEEPTLKKDVGCSTTNQTCNRPSQTYLCLDLPLIEGEATSPTEVVAKDMDVWLGQVLVRSQGEEDRWGSPVSLTTGCVTARFSGYPAPKIETVLDLA